MSSLVASTVGRKYLMALSGLVWVGFVFMHMTGNMLIFLGPEAYNAYSHALISTKLIYLAEAVLVGALLAHVGNGILLTIRNRSARPRAYHRGSRGPKAASFGSRTMIFQGTAILAFIILHLLTFKFGTYYETTVNGIVMRDLYRLIIEVFQQPVYVVGYVVVLLLMALHLSHGAASMFQSFGLLHPSYQCLIKRLSWMYSVVVVAGFISQPLYVYLFAGMGS